MQLKTIRIKNYKVFQDVEIKDIGPLAVFLGQNGTGKSTLFDVFGFIRQCLMENVSSALQARGGFGEVLSRGARGDIEFSIQYRVDENAKLCTYDIAIGQVQGKPVVLREQLRYRRGQSGRPWNFVDFSMGNGHAITNEDSEFQDIRKAEREPFELDSPDILAIKSLGQMRRFRAAAEFRRFIEDWFVSDFQINVARQAHDSSYEKQLTRNGDNLANVAQYMKDEHPRRFNDILQKMKMRVPGVENVEAKPTEDGRVVLRFSDGRFKDPFSARYVSDGTIKMFAYLVMLSNPNPHMLMCVEEPENQLYPNLLRVLIEEFREYTANGGQVFISTHSPDLVNSLELPELYCLRKMDDGYTKVFMAKEDAQIAALFNTGDRLGDLWKQDLL